MGCCCVTLYISVCVCAGYSSGKCWVWKYDNLASLNYSLLSIHMCSLSFNGHCLLNERLPVVCFLKRLRHIKVPVSGTNLFTESCVCFCRKEISKIMKSSYLRGLNMASFFCASKIIVFITFTIYVLLGNTISASRVFVTVSLYTAVRLTVTLFFPSAIEKLFETRVSIRRIQVWSSTNLL